MSFPVAPLGEEEVPLEQALDRVLAADITAREDIPPFPRSLVDGYAVRVKDTYGAREGTPAFLQVEGEVLVGEVAEKEVDDGQAVYVATGAMMPDGADGVVMVEYTRQAGAAIEVTRTVRRGENICFRGEDLQKGQVVLEKGQVHIALRPRRSGRPRGHPHSRLAATRGAASSPQATRSYRWTAWWKRARSGTLTPIPYRV